jgi:hypothetical protein
MAEEIAGEAAALPRRHHYLYAHRVLPWLVASDPQRFLDTLAVAGDTFLVDVWDAVGEREVPVEERLPSTGLHHTHYDWTTATLDLIELPDAQCVTEAHLIGVLVARPPAPDGPPRYLTLEESADLEGNRMQVLCAWEADRHVNYGRAAEGSVAGFVEAVRAMVVPYPRPLGEVAPTAPTAPTVATDTDGDASPHGERAPEPDDEQAEDHD